ncbi:MAG TPA: hypothetical protein VM534_02445 [Thermoanaerobaculia bacterium]|nr:hypothetical protein [Thermoanaerobaculia bacterium]
MIRRRRIEFWESLLITFLFFYLAPLVAVAWIHTYGIRMMVPAVPSLLLLSIRGVSSWRDVVGGGAELAGAD